MLHKNLEDKTISEQILDLNKDKTFHLESNSTPFEPIVDDPTSMLDITSPETVEIQIRNDATTIWINVDGICRLRACRIKNLILIDEHSNKNTVYPTNDKSNSNIAPT